MEYTYGIVETIPGQRLVKRTADGPFPMDTSYTWDSVGGIATRMTPFMSFTMRRATNKDLARLKQLLENSPHDSCLKGKEL